MSAKSSALPRETSSLTTVDVVPGRGASFSLEAPLNLRFLIRSSLCELTADIEKREEAPGG